MAVLTRPVTGRAPLALIRPVTGVDADEDPGGRLGSASESVADRNDGEQDREKGE
jgi:hypothetical protein